MELASFNFKNGDIDKIAHSLQLQNILNVSFLRYNKLSLPLYSGQIS